MNPNTWVHNETKRFKSILKKLRKEERIDEGIEIFINDLTLEELIAVKLELSATTLKSPLYGIPIYNHLKDIVEDAVLKFAISNTASTTEASRFLGIGLETFGKAVRKYNLWEYFDTTYYRKPKKKKEGL